MSMKQEQKPGPGADKDPFAQLSLGVERAVRKKKALNDDDLNQQQPEAPKQGHATAESGQSKASADAAAVLMSHWSDQKAPTAAPIDTLTTADRQRMMDKRKVINDPKKSDKGEHEKASEPSKAQSHE